MPGASLDTATAPEETVLDVEALASLAPGLQRITPIFVPLDQSFSNSFLLFMFGALDPSRQGGRLPHILSISDGVCESRFTPDQLRLGRRLLVQAAALGITTLAASGDLGFQGCFINKAGALFPSSSPFATSVGGTDLTLAAGNEIADQVVWSTFATQPSQGVGSAAAPARSGGDRAFSKAPGVGPALQPGKPTRLSPDLAAMASYIPGLAVFDKDGGGWGIGGGTSAATPLTAAIVALVLEQERKAGRPQLWARFPRFSTSSRGGADYNSIFFDITSGTSSRRPNSTAGQSPAGGAAQPGYDLATGLGTLKAAALRRCRGVAARTTHAVKYMVIERFRRGAAPVYERAADKGRMLPEGLSYVDSWVDERLHRCFQLMEADDAGLFDQWTARWNDLVEFDIVPVIDSREAGTRAFTKAGDPEQRDQV